MGSNRLESALTLASDIADYARRVGSPSTVNTNFRIALRFTETLMKLELTEITEIQLMGGPYG